MKKKLSLLLAVIILMAGILAVPVHAEERQTQESSTLTSVTEPSKPTETTPSEPEATTKPTEEGTDSTTTPTEAIQPKPCSHVYGEWDADEGSHWRVCTLCGQRDSSGHSWASETITVKPTCKDPGGVCKICTVCQGVLVTEIIQQTSDHVYDNSCDDECNVCGLERQVTHSFGIGWTYNYKGHWHKCTVCSAAGEVKSHYPGPAATEEKDQICLTCGYIMTKKLAHTHKYTSEWSSDDTGHWHVCTGCKEKEKFTAHIFDNDCDTDCSECGYQRAALHEFGTWYGDDNGHWQECGICGEKTETIAHEASQSGDVKTQCIVCLHLMTVEHIHEFSAQWKKDDTFHWQECACGERAEAGEHDWDEGTKGKKIITYTCEICQAERQEEVPEKEFSFVLILAGGGILICLIGITASILILRRREDDE